MRLRALLPVAVLLSASLAAHADSFTFSFGSASDAFSGSGVLTTGVLLAPGEYTIAGVTGLATTSANGAYQQIASILAPGTFPTVSNGGTFPANDDVLFVNQGIGTLDESGLSFLLADGTQINLFNNPNPGHDALLEPLSGANVVEEVPVSITQMAPTPEPSAFVLLATGILGIAGAVKRRVS